MKDFKAFLLRGNLIDLAVAVVIGVAFTAVVTAFVNSLITPLIKAIFGGQNQFSGLYFTLNGSKFTYGLFLNALVSFVIIAVIGLFWAVVWLLSVTERPEQNRHISAAEIAEIAADQEPPRTGPPIPLGALLTRPAVLATAFAFFGYAYILYFFLSWFPTYLTNARHLSLQSMSFVSAIPWLLGFIGLAAGGSVSDAIFRITGNAVRARKLVLVGALLVAALCVALAGSVQTVQAAVALMAVSVFFMYLTGNTYWAIILDTVDRDRVGGVGGFVHLIANTAGIVAPSVTGFMVQATGGSYTGAFGLAGGIAVLGALSVAIFVRAPVTAAAMATVATRA